MKRSVLTGLNNILILFFIASCQKENRLPKSEFTKNPISTTKQQDLRMWWDSGREPGFEGIDYGCEGIGGNCLPDAVVTPKPASLLTDFAQSSNPGTFASTHYQNLSKIIDNEILDRVINKQLDVSIRGEIGIGKTGYLKFSSGNGTPLIVYPFRQ